MCRKMLLLILVIGLSAPTTWAVSITVENFSFELPNIGTQQKCWDGEKAGTVDVPGWTDGPASASNSGIEKAWPGSTHPGTTDWAGFVYNLDSSVWNLTDHTIVTGDEFTLQIDLQNNWTSGTGPASLKLSLFYDDAGTRVPVASTTVTISTEGAGTWSTSSLQFAAANAPSSVGHQLGIEVNNVTAKNLESWIGMDYVRLECPVNVRAWGPYPPSGDIITTTNVVLQWNAGKYAANTNGHRVYFDPCEAKVQARSGCDVNGVSYTEPTCYVPGLTPSWTYYWAIDEVNDVNTWKGDVWRFKVQVKKAYNPTPADGAQRVIREVEVLEWKPGADAISHHVYFGTNYDNVNAGIGGTDKGTRTEPNWPVTPSPLEPNTTYFWRVDEYDGATTLKGDIWSFTTTLPGLGLIKRELYTDIGGGAVTDLTSNPKYPDQPDEVNLINVFEFWSLGLDNYGSRTHGWLWPPATGNYTFWTTSEDSSQLWLSTDESTQNIMLIAQEPGEDPNWQSAPITLQGNKRYYIMALQKESSGEDGITVAWQGPTIPTRTVITGGYLEPFENLQAFNPNPTVGAIVADNTPNLSWSAGIKAASVNGHKVYLDSSEQKVIDRSGCQVNGISTTDPCYPIATPLELEQTFYWAVDEVNGSDIWKGNTWNFTTAPYIPPVNEPNLVGWWTLDEGYGSAAYDYSGHNNHGKLRPDVNGPVWTDGILGGALQLDGVDDYVDCPNSPSLNITGAITLALWVNTNDSGNGQDNEYIAKGDNSYAIKHYYTNSIQFFIYSSGAWYTANYPIDSSFNGTWHHLAGTYDGSDLKLYVDGGLQATTAYTGSIAIDAANLNLGRNTDVTSRLYEGTLDDVRIYNRALTQSEIGKIISTLQAWAPNPTNNATDVEPTLTLTWKPGIKVKQHDVYFSDNWDDVNEAKSSDPNGPAYVYKGRQDANSYTIPSPLEFDTTYYWRIDEVNEPNIWRGRIWRFTTANFVIKDNFESYNNTTNKIQNTWVKGGGGTVGYPDVNYAELTIVHGGRQSMPFDYNNTSSAYSEATRTYGTAQDWTAQGVKSLSLWLRGYPAPVGGLTRSGSSPNYSYTMTASGTDINIPNWRFPSKMRDEFHYAYVQVNYECDIIAKVDSISNTDPEAKAGLMLRDSLADDSAYVMMCITPSSGIWYQYRPTAGQLQDSGRVTQSGLAAPHWLWLRREFNGSDYEWSGYYSAKSEPNQYDWTPLVSDGNIPVTAHSSVDTVYIGLVVTASNATATCTGVFSNVSVTDGGLGSMYNNWPARANPVALPWPCPNADIGIKSNNAAPLYVTLQDSTNAKKVTHPDPNIVLSTSWQAWNIALSDFAGVNLAAIKKITIGVDSMSTPAGTLYFDDIRLYIPRCLPGTIPDPTSSDCLIEYYNLNILTNNWLISNYQVTPAAPSDANLVAHYKFDGDFTDSAGNNDGEPNNGAIIINDAIRGQVANFDGTDDYVSLPIGPDINSMSSATFATWVNFSNGGGAWQRIFDFGSSTTVYMFLTPRTGTTGPMRFAIITTGTTTESGINAPSTLARGWHHVAVVINGANMTMQLYLDGVVVASGTTAILPKDLGNTTNNWLGRSQWTADAYLNGYLDDFRIYNRALSPGEIASLAGKTASFTQPLYLLLTPQNQGINLYNDGRIDLKDYAVLADLWLEELLWP